MSKQQLNAAIEVVADIKGITKQQVADLLFKNDAMTWLMVRGSVK